MASRLSADHYHDEQAALEWVEARVWPDGPICPHCGSVERATALKGNSTRLGVYKCLECRKPFTVKVGTVFESSHVPLHVWLQAIALLTASKKGMSSNQLHRILGVTLKTAWFMSHRIREAMKDGSLGPLGGKGRTVEADETFFGRREGVGKPRGGTRGVRPIMALVEREGSVRSFHVDEVNSKTAKAILNANADPASDLITDEGRHYRKVGREFAKHERVHHTRGEYVRPDDRTVHTNTIEGYFGIFKRGMKGVYQHCAEKHLHRYLAEFDFRYNARVALGVDDQARAEKALRGIVGKRLTYRTTDRQAG
jgi:transposase-like protein